jgi:hypothetical protein
MSEKKCPEHDKPLVEVAHPAAGAHWGTDSIALEDLAPNKRIRLACQVKGCDYKDDVKA